MSHQVEEPLQLHNGEEQDGIPRADGVVIPPKRFRASWFYLTYAALSPGEVSKEQVHDMMKKSLPRDASLRQYIIFHEDHPSPTHPDLGVHIHALGQSSKRLLSLDIRCHLAAEKCRCHLVGEQEAFRSQQVSSAKTISSRLSIKAPMTLQMP